MLKACSHMHSKGIIHRDFKPENMLLSKNSVLKVCDFGSARSTATQTPLTEYVSTRWYRAPELLVSHATYSTGIDIWAIGCIFVELLTGKALFNGKNEYDMLRLILKMFQGSEDLPLDLKQMFYQNNIFSSVKLPTPEGEFDFSNSLEARLEGLANNAAVSFARECLRLDPARRPQASELLEHDFFSNFKEWFDNEIKSLIKHDTEDAINEASIATKKNQFRSNSV